MTAREAIQFAFDWPELPFLKPLCIACGGATVRRADAVSHMDQQHPGWLDAWNAELRKYGIVT